MTDKDLLQFRKAVTTDITGIVQLLAHDDLGTSREELNDLTPYEKAFKIIDADAHQKLMVLFYKKELAGTCHLTVMPSLTYQGKSRMQIEAVRIAKDLQGQGLGRWMFVQIKDIAKKHHCHLLQLSTDMRRKEAQAFYQTLGFEASHLGMKMLL